MNEHYAKIHSTSHQSNKYSPASINSTAQALEEFDMDPSEDEYPFDCPLCSPTQTSIHCQNLEQLTVHVLTVHHRHQSCPFCSYLIQSKSDENLLEHVKLHFNGSLARPDVEQVKELCILG